MAGHRVLVVGGDDGVTARLDDAGVSVVAEPTVDAAVDRLAGGDDPDCVVVTPGATDLLVVLRDRFPGMPAAMADESGMIASRPRNGGLPDGVRSALSTDRAGDQQDPDRGRPADPGDVADPADASDPPDPGRAADRPSAVAPGDPPVDLPGVNGTIAETLGDPIYALDAEGTLTYVNDATTELLGRPAGEIVGRDFESFLPAEDAARSDELVASLLESDRTDDTFEMAVENADGERIPVENHVAVRFDDGAFVGTVGVLRDISARKAREEELEQYETIIHALADPVYATDAEGYFTFVNPTFEEILGHPREEVVGKPMHFAELVDEEDAERIYDLVRRLLSSDVDRRRGTIEIQGLLPDGRRIPVEDSLAILPYDDQFQGAAGVLRDISDRKRQQQRLEVMNRVLRHNVRNQMNVIGGSAETIVEMSEDPTVLEVARSVREAAAEMTEISDNVRDLQEAIDREREATVDVVDVVDAVLREQRERFPDAVIVRDTPAAATVAAGRSIRYALGHLIENAVEHNDSHPPHVEVRVRPDDRDDWVRVEVADDGPGIPDQDRAVVTGSVEADPLQHGSGLGLWIVNWIVESYGGGVEIDDSEDGGTVVAIRLPLA